jgi:cob(I)alamin adenosyltransferase
MRIYSRKGNKGKTRLEPGRPEVSKSSPSIQALGSLDELCSAIGLALAAPAPADIADALKRVQRLLFDLGAELARHTGKLRIRAAHLREIEGMIDSFDAQLQPLKKFILLGGSELASRLHLARAICRRAEREVVAFAQEESASVSAQALAFMNRLSDLLFVLARLANKRLAIPEEEWHPEEE